jgi:type II secretory pathway component PulF
VRSALIYPTILIFVAVASVMVLLVFVVPQFQSTFAQAGKALPLPTQVVIVVGTFLRNWWWAVIPGIALAVAWFRRRGRVPAVRRARDARLLRMPLLGDLIAKVEIARFARTLATLLANGVTLLAGLAIVKETMGNVVLVGTVMRKWWWAIGAFVVLFALWFPRHLKRPTVKYRWDQRLLTMPLIGDLVTKVEVARFSRTLSTLLANGVTLLAGLAIVKETLSNGVLANALDGVTARLREGKGFGRPLADTGLYPKLATQMILVGEESGRLEEMLTRVAEIYDREVQMAIKRFLAVLEPVMILGLAVMIGGIVFSILLGVMGMSELVQ